MSTTLSFEQARDLLVDYAEDYQSPESLVQLANLVSVQCRGQVSLFYCDMAHPDISCNDLVEIMLKNHENIRTINDTPLARFLQSKDFLEAVARFHHCASVEQVLSDRSHLANQFMFDINKGRWADASARFAAATKGEVIILSGYASADRTLGLVVLPALLDNPEVQTINAQSKLVFQEIYRQTGSITEVFKAITASSYLLMRDLEAKSNSHKKPEGSEKNSTENVGTHVLFTKPPDQGAYLAKDLANLSLSSIPTPQAKSYIKEGLKYLDEYAYVSPPPQLLSVPSSPSERLVKRALRLAQSEINNHGCTQINRSGPQKMK